jgi:hypothetical protein
LTNRSSRSTETPLPALHTLRVSVFPTLLRTRLRQSRQIPGNALRGAQRRLQWEVPLLQLIVEWEIRYRAGSLDQEATDRILTAIAPLSHADHARSVAATGLLWGATYLPPTDFARDPPLPPIDDSQHR